MGRTCGFEIEAIILYGTSQAEFEAEPTDPETEELVLLEDLVEGTHFKVYYHTVYSHFEIVVDPITIERLRDTYNPSYEIILRESYPRAQAKIGYPEKAVPNNKCRPRIWSFDFTIGMKLDELGITEASLPEVEEREWDLFEYDDFLGIKNQPFIRALETLCRQYYAKFPFLHPVLKQFGPVYAIELKFSVSMEAVKKRELLSKEEILGIMEHTYDLLDGSLSIYSQG